MKETEPSRSVASYIHASRKDGNHVRIQSLIGEPRLVLKVRRVVARAVVHYE